jgi:hypothetical protein|tara:strand:+ start:248 stop:571 length:324 start_codon:yes stop_codon:yes gene_type:complete
MSVEDFIDKVKKNYSQHEKWEELEGDIKQAELFGASFYELKRIGYHLCEVFDDKEMSKKAFEMALELASGYGSEEEDLSDVIDDISFLSIEWAEALKEKHGINDEDE